MDIINLVDATNKFQTVISALAIIISILIYMREQSRQRIETIKRSSEAILKEIDENEHVLRGGNYEKITYTVEDKLLEQNKTSDNQVVVVNYTNAYLDMDAYQSIVFSGSFTHFSASTQHKLTMLYSRIRSRNETITYTDHLEDMFFMHEDDSNNNISQQRKEKWFKDIRKYDLLITRYENEILQYLDEVRPLLNEEKKGNKQKAFISKYIRL
jgi:hypothetical protein